LLPKTTWLALWMWIATPSAGAAEEVLPDAAEANPTADRGTLPDADRPAVDAPVDENLWIWVDRLGGEVPTTEQVEALNEREEEILAEGPIAAAPEVTPIVADPDDPLFLKQIDPSEFDIPVVVNDDVVRWMRYFTGSGRKYYARYLSRAPRYRPMMIAKLKAAGLPEDLVYLSMIESGYNPHAYSHADAAGLWQFIESTGRLYHLRIDWWVDERRDPARSTDAAIELLSDLHTMFDDWPLAWAAYNTGPGRVQRAIDNAGSRDFWVIERGSYLHSETENYVPKIMAAAIIGHHPERYGFAGIEGQPELAYEVARVDGTVDLEVLAKCAGISLAELQELNPALRRWATPSEGYELRVPVGRTASFLASLAEVPAEERITVVRHTVRRGETLAKIADRYDTSVSQLAKANRLKDADVIHVGQVLVVPTKDRPVPPPHATAVAAKTEDADATARSQTREATTAPAPKPAAKKATTSKVKYTVRRGDTLSGIAARHGVALSDVQKWNGIRDASAIQAGQVLVIHVRDDGWTRYTVRAGDSLGAIARKHGCSVSDLREWNDLASTVIQPGQVLKIRK
jgi:membrane-bound lytic murein transglycosylase D